MAGRNYPKGAAKREEILDAALEMIAKNGYKAATIRGIADAVGLSKTGVEHHFASKHELLTAMLTRRDETGIDPMDHEGSEDQRGPEEAPFEGLRHAITAESKKTGIMELYVRLIAEATDPENVAHDYFVERFRRLDDAGVVTIAHLQQTHQAPSSIDPHVLSIMLMAISDGLQIRKLYDHDENMETVVDAVQLLLELAAAADK